MLRLVALGGMLILFAGMGKARAEDDRPDAIEDLKSRIEALEKQNQRLMKIVESRQGAGEGPADLFETKMEAEPDLVRKVVADYLKEEDKKKKAEEERKKKQAEDEGFEVGKDLTFKTRWDHGVWFETADKAFRVHVGGRTQFDLVWGRAPNDVEFGVGGIGRINDGVNFRRGRLEMDGWIYEVIDFFCEYDFFQAANVDPTLPATENNVIDAVAPTDLWAAINFIPKIGTVRIGNMKPGISLEHLTSSRYLDFIERSINFDPYFNRNNGFQPGIQILNWTENERMSWQVGVFKNNNTVFGWNNGDGEYQLNARVTALPWYEHNGRCMIHLGVGVQYDEPDQSNAILRQRWGLRNGPASLQNTVALASLFGNEQLIVVPEFFMNLGPLSVQAEYFYNQVAEVRAFQTQPQGRVIIPGPTRTFASHGYYVQALYFLTGEHRPYGRTGLHSSGAAPTRVVPISNFFWTRGAFSAGAWQVGARYAYSDLSNNGIFGGEVHEGTLGVNWFLNPNMKIQWNYVLGHRGDLGPTTGISSEGTYQGFGTRLAFDW